VKKKSILEVLRDKQLVHPPKWLPSNTHYLVITGSVAYAVSSDTSEVLLLVNISA